MRSGDSSECGKSELDLFTLPPTQIVVEEGEYHDIQPESGFNSGNVFFQIRSESNTYIDLSQTELWVQLKIKNGTQLASDDDLKKIGPINNFLHSIFSQIQVSFNNEEVENSNSNYAYRAYLENLLCYEKEIKDTFMLNELFCKDDSGQFDNQLFEEKTLASGEVEKPNSGLLKRRDQFIDRQNLVQLCGRLHSDVFNINKYLLPNINVNVTLTRSKHEFCFITTLQKIHCEIENCFLRIRKVKVSPTIMTQHAMELEKTTAKYPIKQVQVRCHNLSYNAATCLIKDVVTGFYPSRIVVGFVDNIAYQGTYETNPFNFKNYNISSIKLKAGSRNFPYVEGLRLDFEKKNYLEGYNTLQQAISLAPKEISYYDYANGNTLFAFDLSPDLCHGDHFSINKDGNLDIEVSFRKTPSDTSVYAIIYCEFDKVIEINKYRQAYVEK